MKGRWTQAPSPIRDRFWCLSQGLRVKEGQGLRKVKGQGSRKVKGQGRLRVKAFF